MLKNHVVTCADDVASDRVVTGRLVSEVQDPDHEPVYFDLVSSIESTKVWGRQTYTPNV